MMRLALLIACLILTTASLGGAKQCSRLITAQMRANAQANIARFGWAAVTRLVETPRHLFIQVSRREALIVPRRAVANEDVYNNLRGFVRARTGLSTR